MEAVMKKLHEKKISELNETVAELRNRLGLGDQFDTTWVINPVDLKKWAIAIVKEDLKTIKKCSKKSTMGFPCWVCFQRINEIRCFMYYFELTKEDLK